MNKITLLTLIALSSPLLAQQAPEGAPPSISDAFMQQLDTDKDGKVTKAEFLQPQEAQFAHIDKNQDGSIDKTEIDAFAAEMQQHMQQLKQQQPTQ
jgi:Ca2+-binding EF-hand superfamily protein